MRVAFGEQVRVQAHEAQRVAGLGARLGGGHSVDAGAEGDLLDRGVARVERGVAVLEHHLHVAAQFPQAESAVADRVAVQDDAPRVGRDQVHQQPGGGGFAAAGLADDAQGLALQDIEAHVVHRLDARGHRAQGAAQGEVLAEAADAEHGLLGAAAIPRGRGAGGRGVLGREAPAHARTSMAARRLSLSRLKLTEAAKIIAPGSTALTGAT